MDSKWFVYIGDHAEGPFSAEQIEAALTAGKLAPGFLAWTRGMQDWLPLEQIEELRIHILEANEQSKSGPKRVGTLTELMALPRANEERSDWIGPAERARALAEAERVLQKMESERKSREQREFQSDVGRQARTVLTTVLVAIVVASIFGFTWLYLTRNSVQSPLRTFLVVHQREYPQLLQKIGPLPDLPIWSESDRARFSQILKSPFGPGSARIAYTVEGKNESRPIFWVVSNFPLQTRLRLRLSAHRGTLETELDRTYEEHFILSRPWSEVHFDSLGAQGRVGAGTYQVAIDLEGDQDPSVQARLAEAGVRAGSSLLSEEAFLGGLDDENHRRTRDHFNRSVREAAIQEMDRLIPILRLNHDQSADLQAFAALKPGKVATLLHGKIESRSAQIQSSLTALDQSPLRYYAALSGEIRGLVRPNGGDLPSAASVLSSDEILKKLEIKRLEFQSSQGVPEF